MKLIILTLALISSFANANEFDERWRQSQQAADQAARERMTAYGHAKAAEHRASIYTFARQMHDSVLENSVSCDEGDASMNMGRYYSCDFKTANLTCRVKGGPATPGRIFCNKVRGDYTCKSPGAWIFTCVDASNRQIVKMLRQRDSL